MTYRPDLAIAEARSYVGTKWAHRGRSRFGVDCIGLIVAALKAGGFDFADRQDYGRTPWKNGLEIELRARMGDPVNDMRAGDIAMMRWNERVNPSHVGVIAEGGRGFTLIHSCSMTSVCEHDIDSLWLDRIVMVFRP